MVLLRFADGPLKSILFDISSSEERRRLITDSLRQDLVAESESHYSRELGASERTCIVADVDTGEVLVYNASEVWRILISAPKVKNRP